MIIVSHDGGAFQRVEMESEEPPVAVLELDGTDIAHAEIRAAGLDPERAVGFWLGDAWYVVGETGDQELARELRELGRRLLELGMASLTSRAAVAELRAA
jgi:hypothetical protein